MHVASFSELGEEALIDQFVKRWVSKISTPTTFLIQILPWVIEHVGMEKACTMADRIYMHEGIGLCDTVYVETAFVGMCLGFPVTHPSFVGKDDR